jgi:hypothetical protein
MEDIMEEVGDSLVVYFNLSSSDRWTNISGEQKSGRLAEDPGGRAS